MTDTELLRQAQSGDRSAWSLLYARYLPSVWRHAIASVNDFPAAEDIVAETMLALVRSLPKLDPYQVDLHVWLRGVLRRKVVDHFRQVNKRQRIHAKVRKNSTQATDAPPTELELEEGRQLIVEALEQLPEFQRVVLEWKHIEGLSVREIAVRTGKSEKAVESTLFRARNEFRRVYERICSETYVTGNGSHLKSEALEKSL